MSSIGHTGRRTYRPGRFQPKVSGDELQDDTTVCPNCGGSATLGLPFTSTTKEGKSWGDKGGLEPHLEINQFSFFHVFR